MRDVVLSAVKPLLLGCGKTALGASLRFFAEYGAPSVVLDKKRTLGSYFYPFSSFRYLPPSESDEFILMSLEKLCDDMPEVTFLLVPCNGLYREFTERNLSRLESRFILRTPDRVCDVTPSPQHTAKD